MRQLHTKLLTLESTEFEEILLSLGRANKQYSKNKDFNKYQSSIQQIFKIPSTYNNVTAEAKFYLGGFTDGEGSLNISAKKTTYTTFGVSLDPEFSLTQHIDGITNLYMAMVVLKAGRIRYKVGSKRPFCLVIDNRKTLSEKVIPFYKTFVNPFSSVAKQKRVYLFSKFLTLFDEGAHLDYNRMINEVLPLWDTMTVKRTRKNRSFDNLAEAQKYVSDSFRYMKER